MKILIVSRWFSEERRRNGGKPGFFGELVQAIVAQGIDLTILSQTNDAGLTPEPRPVDGLDVHVFSREGRNGALFPLDKAVKWWGGYRKAVSEAAIIRRFVRQRGPFDAVIAQCEEPDGLSCALASPGGAFPPLVTFVHDLRYDFRPEGIHFIRKSSLGFVFARSARVVANSEQTADWLRREYGVGADKIGQCRIHLTAPFLNLATTAPVQLETEGSHILFLGALNRKKAPDLFLQAAQLIAPQLPGWKFVVVGPETSDDRAFRTKWQDLAAQPSLADKIELLGRLDAAAVIDQIRRARVVVCPSRIETFSRTTIEALALGRPVIVTATTGAAHWVESTGCGSVVPPENAGALADAMLAWTKKSPPPGAAQAVTEQLTADRAAQDWIREVRVVLTK